MKSAVAFLDEEPQQSADKFLDEGSASRSAEAFLDASPEPSKPPTPYVPSGERKSVLDTLSEGLDSIFKRPAPTVNAQAENERARLMLERQQRSGTAEELAAFAADDERRAAAAKPQGSEIIKGFVSGTIGTNPKLLGDALEGFGTIAGSQTMQAFGTKLGAFGRDVESGLRPRVGSVTEIKGPADVGAYAGFGLGQGVATSLPSIATGALTALLTANPFFGLALGAFGASYPQNYGDVYGSARDDPEIMDRIKAGELTKEGIAKVSMAAAVPMAALDALAIGGIFGRSFAGMRQDLLKRIAKGIGEGAIIEGSTEGLQEVISQWAQTHLGSQKQLKDQFISVVDNFLLGAVSGGAMGGGAGAVQRQPTAKEVATEAAAREIGAAAETVEFSTPAEQVAVDLLSPERAQMRVVPKEAPAAPQQADVEVEAEVRQPIEFTPTLAAGEQAGEVGAGEAQAEAAIPEAPPEEAPVVARPSKPRRRPPAFMSVDAGKDSLTTAIAKLGGLALEEASDITGERRTERAPDSPMRFVIRRNGGLDLDSMAERLVELGFLQDQGAHEQLREMIRDELDGRRQHFSDWAMGDRFDAEFERQNDIAEQHAALEAEAVKFAEESGIPEIEREIPQARFDSLPEFVPQAEAELDGPKLVLAELTERAAAVDEAAVERLAIESEGMADTEYAAKLQEIINANVEAVPAGPVGVGEGEQAFALAGQTEGELAVREAAAGDRERAEREAIERDRADRERGAFVLTGSERTADELAARGQEDLKFQRGAQFSPDFVAANREAIPRLQAIAARLTPTVDVRFADRLLGSGPQVEASGAAAPAEQEVAGVYSWRENLISVALNYASPETALRHESVHALKANGFFTKAEWQVLAKESRSKWQRAYNVPDVEEGVAYAFGDYRSGSLDALPAVQRIFRKLADLLQRLGNLLRGMGFQSPESIFRRIEAGEVGARPQDMIGPWFDGNVKYALGPNVANPPTAQQRQAYVASAARKMRQTTVGPVAPNTWQGDLGRLNVLFVTPRTIAAFERDFVPVYQTAIAQWEYRDELIARLEREAEPYFKASEDDKAIVNKVLEHDRLTGQIGLAGANKTVQFTSNEAALSKPGERLTVTDEQKSAYWSARRMLDTALDLFRDQTLEDFGLPRGMTAAQIVQQAAQTTVKADQDRLVRVAEVVQSIEDARRRGYVPFSRYGEVGIVVRDRLTNAVAHYEQIELGILDRRPGKRIDTIPEVKARLEALRKKYGVNHAVSDPFQIPKTGQPRQVRLEEMDALAEIAKVDNQTWESVRADLQKAVAAQGFRQHFFRAKNTPGYSTDFERSLANYITGISGYLARRRYAKEWVASIAKIPTTSPRLRQYAQDYQTYVNSPNEEFSALRSINFVYYLTSPASWIVNLTQVPFVSMPWATQFSNPVAVSAAFARAEVEAAMMLSFKQGVQLFDPAKAPRDVAQAVQDAFDKGLFIPLTTYESMGIAQRRKPRLRKLGKAGETAVELFGLGFTGAERHNRIATFIALYRLARNNPQLQANFARVMGKNALAEPLIANWSPAGFAEFGIDDTHFKMGKVNRPTLARNAGTLVFQFKLYMLNYLERAVTMMALQGPAGRAAAASMLMILGLMAGVWGLPGAENLRDLWETLYKKIKNRDLNLDAEMRSIIVALTGSTRLAEAVSGGGSRALPEPWNIDLSKRVGIGKILPSEPGELLGVSYDLWWKRPTAAIEQFEVDNLLLALAEVSPKFAQDIATAFAWAEQGVRTKARDFPVIPKEKVTPGMQITKAIGFTPGTIANIREGERAERRALTAVDEQRQDFYRKLGKAAADEQRAEDAGNPVAQAKARQEIVKIFADIDKWNEGKPDHERIVLNRRTAAANLVREFYGAEYDKGQRKQARGEVQRLREVYGREGR